MKKIGKFVGYHVLYKGSLYMRITQASNRIHWYQYADAETVDTFIRVTDGETISKLEVLR